MIRSSKWVAFYAYSLLLTSCVSDSLASFSAGECRWTDALDTAPKVKRVSIDYPGCPTFETASVNCFTEQEEVQSAVKVCIPTEDTRQNQR